MRTRVAALAMLLAAAVTAAPGCGESGASAPQRDYAEEWAALVRHRQGIGEEAQDGARALDAAIRTFHAVLSTSTPCPPPSETEPGRTFGFAHALAPDATPEAHAEGARVLGELQAAGFFAQLGELRNFSGVSCPKPASAIVDVVMPELGVSRHITRAQVYRIRLAAAAGRWPEVREAAEQAFTLASVFLRRATLEEHLLGAAIVDVTLAELASVLPGRIDDPEVCAGLLAAVERLPASDLGAALEGELLIGLDLAVREAPQRGDRESAGRDEEAAKVAELFGHAQRVSSRPVRGWGADLEEMGAWLVALPGRYKVTHLCVPALVRALASRDSCNTMRDGMRVLLAVEGYRIEHGELPAALEQLVPGHLAGLPADPYAEGAAPFRYARLDPAADVRGRAYVLYSVGWDGVDNHGGEHPRLNSYAATSVGSGYDFLVNAAGGQE